MQNTTADHFSTRGRKPHPKEVQQMHRDTILKSLDHRLEVARQNGDDRLVAMLEAERRQFN